MRNVTLFEGERHQFILLNESEPGEEDGVRSNQYLVMHDQSGVLLDPGGFGVMPRVLAEMLRYTTQIRSITGGRGYFTMELDHYDTVPQHLAAAIIELHKKEQEAKKEE